MKNLRKYGKAPFSVAVIHGGPGAPGEMATVARELSAIRGILEPLQTKATLEGQVRELKAVLEDHGDLPITLIGFSWGAMLSFIFTARYPQFIKKLILIGSGPYEEKYAANIMNTRISRLGKEDWENFLFLTETLNDPSAKNRDEALCSFGTLMSKTDAYDPLPHEKELLECSYEAFKGVWGEASELRRSGKLLELGTKIMCPVIAIHGDYDPHPFEGVREPLSGILKDFRFILLEKCGHMPWIERAAKEIFYNLLKKEIW
ncbi:alpha/beta hydrolase [Methanosarcina sp. 2.H.T.1A.6]|uniref:alpha/beta fold hydrolase n=1 Tax=unclassified Methanosarcina TaxID=2644672 RepID=UPI0006228B69|nr:MULTISPECIES: alpha/beta hydrolase [unclassified Methanosarcina]KKG10255.1 alpha/beta hydrolase [Methanosarcina sp. 2.H.T.1A.15]KKG15536.1 alpha/beta hydrolase [Methanosarcina sp. 2.H.T.1A.3]KKG24171.1 alpha/beta hydrolase [Methanosarcina sp. 2.H.T.1A.6]KKG25641.1 alpha/beta hydrolase [Methanosarcina sp. 2.H.T.1A.8]